MASSRMFSSEQRAKLTQVVNESVGLLQEIEDLNAGLNDTIKAVAEEMEIKPAILKKAIKIAQKSKLGDTNADHEELNTILETVGRTL
jgi:cell division septum initiation protein DivIVA